MEKNNETHLIVNRSDLLKVMVQKPEELFDFNGYNKKVAEASNNILIDTFKYEPCSRYLFGEQRSISKVIMDIDNPVAEFIMNNDGDEKFPVKFDYKCADVCINTFDIQNAMNKAAKLHDRKLLKVLSIMFKELHTYQKNIHISINEINNCNIEVLNFILNNLNLNTYWRENDFVISCLLPKESQKTIVSRH